MSVSPSLQRYWQKTRCWTGALLLLWCVVSFVLPYFARDLTFNFLGWPFSFWVASQGALLVYLGIIGLYAHVMHCLDCKHDVAEDE